MGEHGIMKLRVCRECGATIRTDAKGIMIHYKNCKKDTAVILNKKEEN